MAAHRQIFIAPPPARLPEADRPALAARATEAFELSDRVAEHAAQYPQLERLAFGVIAGLNSIATRIADGLEAGASDEFFAPDVLAFENAKRAAEDLLNRQNLDEFDRLALQTPPETVREFNPPPAKASP
jgi:hypothetical protein